ncbi:MAG: DUF488 domain-containing protein [Acidiferrobacter sp.]
MAELGSVHIRRVYEPVARDAKRWLVDRMWPRGVSKAAAALDGWAREAAPTDTLRRWFGHDPARFAEFRRRYLEELRSRPEPLAVLLRAADEGDIDLLYAARDTRHNHAVVLQEYLEGWRHA